MSEFDRNLEQMIKHDRLGFEAGEAVHTRLVNYLKANPVFWYIRKNAILPAVNTASRFSAVVWKYGIAATFFLLVVFGTKMGQKNTLFVQNDTIGNTQFVDTIVLDSVGRLR